MAGLLEPAEWEGARGQWTFDPRASQLLGGRLGGGVSVCRSCRCFLDASRAPAPALAIRDYAHGCWPNRVFGKQSRLHSDQLCRGQLELEGLVSTTVEAAGAGSANRERLFRPPHGPSRL
jgi:hypothetical protein